MWFYGTISSPRFLKGSESEGASSLSGLDSERMLQPARPLKSSDRLPERLKPYGKASCVSAISVVGASMHSRPYAPRTSRCTSLEKRKSQATSS